MRRAWDKLHNFEQKEKKAFLGRLNTQEAFDIFENLYELSAKAAGRFSVIVHSEKIKILAKTHSIFNKIKK